MVVLLTQEIIFESGRDHAVVDETLRRRCAAQIRTPLPEHVFSHFDSPSATGASKDIRQRLFARNSADVIEKRLRGELVHFERLDFHAETLAKRATFYQPGVPLDPPRRSWIQALALTTEGHAAPPKLQKCKVYPLISSCRTWQVVYFSSPEKF